MRTAISRGHGTTTSEQTGQTGTTHSATGREPCGTVSVETTDDSTGGTGGGDGGGGGTGSTGEANIAELIRQNLLVVGGALAGLLLLAVLAA